MTKIKQKLDETVIEETTEEINAIVEDSKELARQYIEDSIVKIDGSHIEKTALRPILEQVLSFF